MVKVPSPNVPGDLLVAKTPLADTSDVTYVANQGYRLPTIPISFDCTIIDKLRPQHIKMRKVLLLSVVSLASLSSALLSHHKFRPNDRVLAQDSNDLKDAQSPFNPGPVQPPMATPGDQDGDNGDGGLTISDILPKTRSINIFASLTRDISSVSGRLESTGQNTTVLAPLNSAMQNLPRKPWEDRPDDDDTVSAARNEDKAAKNLQRFVEEHIVPASPWKPGKDNKIATLGGQELWWEERSGKKVILPGELIVDEVIGRVGNGEVWSLKGVVNYA